ncbi:PA0069 family radical SAM protein [Piscinibacter sakaiensis]|uniref:PA0069 family radical SAM protein n=1 Tax=Piscinibacter sakaiensis TaxID=1547922 RepID=UPI003AAE4F77
MKHRRRIDLIPAAPDALPSTVKGRGTAWAIEHRFGETSHDQFDDGWGALDQLAELEVLPPQTQVIEETVKTILTANESPDINFDLSINPYRGCEHGCIYCFARPTHSYLNLSPGLDFETRIIAKHNAAERLEQALNHPRYQPKLLNIGSATDAYQPVERELRITRSVIEVLSRYRHPFSLVTKSSGVERDLDLLRPLAEQRGVAVYVSLTTLDPALARIMEPRAAAPHRRLRTIRSLAEAGIPVGVSISPMIPFINEPELERLLEAAAEAGAGSAFMVVLRLPWEVNPLFQRWLDDHFPDRAARVMARVREIHGGKDYNARFGTRQRGSGVWAELLQQRFDKACIRYGLGLQRRELDLSQFRRPSGQAAAGDRPASSTAAQNRPQQASLF